MLMVGRQRYPQAVALLLHNFHRKTRMSITSLQHRGDSQPPRRLERFKGSEWPGMDDVNLPRKFLEPSSHNPVMHSNRAHRAQDAVRKTNLPPRQRRGDSDRTSNWPAQRSGKNEDVRTRR